MFAGYMSGLVRNHPKLELGSRLMATLQPERLFDVTLTSKTLWNHNLLQGVVIIFLLILLMWLQLVMSSKTKALKLPPGPRPWPILGNIPHLMGYLRPHRRLMELSKKYGPIMFLRLGSVPTVVTNSPEIVREILKHQDHIFCSRPSSAARDIMAYGGAGFALSDYGPHWRYLRRVCIRELLSPSRIQRYEKDRHNEAQLLVAQVLDASKKAQEVNLTDLLTTFTMNVATMMILSKKYFGPLALDGEQAEAFKECLHEGLKLFGVFNIGDYVPLLKPFDLQGYEHAMKQVKLKEKRVLNLIMREHYESKARLRRKGSCSGAAAADDIESAHDFVDVLMALPGEDGAPRLSDDTMEALILELLSAATDTTAVVMEWTLAELVRNPQMQSRVQEEIRTACDVGSGIECLVQESHLNELQYLKAVLKESTRLHPGGSFPIPHMSMEATKVAGYDIPKNTTVLINLMDLGRNPSSFDNPEEFDPDRWLREGNVELKDADMRFIPFSGGRRMCPGASVAQCTVMLVLARLLQAFDWGLPQGKEDVDLNEAFGLTFGLLNPLKAVPTCRLPPEFYTSEFQI
jgi:cytochrome P450